MLHHTHIFLNYQDSANNLYVKWDGAEQIWVHVDEDLFGKTAGLCGTFNRYVFLLKPSGWCVCFGAHEGCKPL